MVDDSACQICSPCLAAKVCRVRAIIRLDADEPPYIDLYRCNDCRLCMAACTFGAIISNPD
jgi:Fe-S-cluster-containing hydrogenase component 2